MRKLILTICLCVLFVSSTALADWKPGDGHKMHWPQLPDPDGWDVKATTIRNPDYDPGDPTGEEFRQRKILADDWKCSSTGYVEDIHFWGSWLHDQEGPIENIHLSIHADIPADQSSTGYSMPGDELWSYDTVVPPLGPFYGDQGWFNPNPPEEVIPYDHYTFWQYNVVDIPDPFWQEEGTIYWLDITVWVAPVPIGQFQPEWGWKTSEYHWNDDAVYGDDMDGDGVVEDWFELYDPYPPYESLDMAFVITPEPATIMLLGLGGLLLRRRKH